MTATPRAVVELLRVSTALQAEEDRASLPAQHAINLRTCELHQLEIVHTVEIVESGAEVARTPEMARMLETVTSGRARGVVLAEYSRLFRPDRWSDLAVLQTLSDHDAPIYIPSGPIDLQTELGFVQATINNLLAAMERRRIRERMDRGKEEHRRRGEHVAGGLGIPYGLAWSKAEGWSWTAEAEVVRELFRRFLAGEWNYEALGRAVGMPRTNVKYLLQNPVYSGWRVYDERRDASPQGKYANAKSGRRKVPRRPEDVIRVRLPLVPVVSEGDFARAQEIVAELASRVVRTPRDSAFPYRGFLACGDEACGLTIYADRRRAGNGAYRPLYFCKTRIRARRHGPMCSNGYMQAGRLEAALDEAIALRLTRADVLAAAIADHARLTEAAAGSPGPDGAALRERAAQLRGRRERILESYYDGHIARERRDALLTPLAREIEAAERLAGMATPQPATPVADAMITAVVACFAEWAFLEVAAKRRALEALRPLFYVMRYRVLGVSLPLAGMGPVPPADVSADGHSPTADAVHNALTYGRTPGGLYVPLSASA